MKKPLESTRVNLPTCDLSHEASITSCKQTEINYEI